MYSKYVKRLFDIILALLALIVLLPVFIVASLLVRIKLGHPVIYRQPRPGLHGKIFILYKFRTMTDQRNEDGQLLPDEIRLTRFGRLLRSTSIDELPELINIIRGDMSIVGPRPLLVEYLDRYNEEQSHRHDVKPGLTGLAQINGRNGISWKEKFNYDLEYVKKISFKIDITIIVMTIKKIITREGINSETSATMEAFSGNNMSDINNEKSR